MKIRSITLLLFCFAVFIFCKKNVSQINHLEIAKEYYAILSKSDDSRIATILMDSLITRETEYDYEQIFSLPEYIDWLKWDASFHPTYEILRIEESEGVVKARISKMDERIAFLHEEPIITEQVIRFENERIKSVETTKYVVFNDSIFVSNRSNLLKWIDEHHPELNGFIYDQTEEGAVNYLRALELYQNRK